MTAAVAFAAARPRRTIPKFGPYWARTHSSRPSAKGEEVAVKLIRRGNVDTAVRMSKVEREIEVLRVSRVSSFGFFLRSFPWALDPDLASAHASMHHTLTHRYLRERDASRLFSQLISGVWYMRWAAIIQRYGAAALRRAPHPFYALQP
ncbi:hypothetical protein C8F04DRAFT_962064 [Mycena alexandri]|uniref:Protein kinase domain-containing protein n=1 Tax=Mycena alexandri TaxID=1745969 RepID=A0AAD6WZC9_9AGAR|nr:hypothetical protein C8F04DRAFT_962064 [Mycena alexandri]